MCSPYFPCVRRTRKRKRARSQGIVIARVSGENNTAVHRQSLHASHQLTHYSVVMYAMITKVVVLKIKPKGSEGVLRYTQMYAAQTYSADIHSVYSLTLILACESNLFRCDTHAHTRTSAVNAIVT